MIYLEAYAAIAVAVALVVAFLCGRAGDAEGAADAAALSLLWPVGAIMLVLFAPFWLVYKLGERLAPKDSRP